MHEVGVLLGVEPVGRDEELARLEAFLDAAYEGRASLLLEGEPGIGKTTLWGAGVDRADQLGFRIVEARPAAAERELAFAALGDLLAGLGNEIGGLPAPQRRALRIALVLEEPSGEPPDERAIAVAALELLRRLAAETPLLLALDDVQWLDPPSAGVLGFAMRRLDGERVGLLAAVRAGERCPLEGFEPDQRLAVGPLSLEALERLVSTRLGARFLRPTLRQLEQASVGNPLYALELAGSLLRSGRRLEPGERLPVPDDLRGLVRERLVLLTPAARRAALAAAALAQPTSMLVERGADVDAAAVEEAVSAGVLVRSGDSVCFAHPLIASTLYDDAPRSERRVLHLRLAAAVENPEERSRHLAEATDGPDPTVAAALDSAAARLATRGAPDAAAHLAKRAVALTPRESGAEAHRRRLAHARYVVAAGDPRLAGTLLEQQLELAASRRERAEVLLELGQTAVATRGAVAARHWFERVVQALEGSRESDLLARAVVELARMELDLGELGSGTIERAVALAEDVAEPRLLASALGLYAVKLDLLGHTPSDGYWRRALAVEASTGELRHDGPTSAYGAWTWFWRDETEGARLMQEVSDSMRARSDPLLPNQLLWMSDAARSTGEWAVASRHIEEASALAVQTGRDALVPHCLVYEGRMAMLRGDLELAAGKVEQALSHLDGEVDEENESGRSEPLLRELAESVLGRIAAQSGRHTEAHAHFQAILRGRVLEFHMGIGETLAEDIACLVKLGRLDSASAELAELAELGAAMALPAMDALGARSRGLLASARREGSTSLVELGRAVELIESDGSQWPYELGRTLLMLGTEQRRARRRLAARATLERALAIFEELGARLWVETTRTELRRLGGRPSSPNALTETERRIAELVASGCSNAETARLLSLSPKTVEWNLTKVYRKLNVRSRTELAARLSRRAVPA